MADYTIREEWEEYYQTLESIRQSGITNMWGAAPYLAKMCDIDKNLATNVLANWIHNYDTLAKKYGWER